jgi:hypothetical protein
MNKIAFGMDSIWLVLVLHCFLPLVYRPLHIGNGNSAGEGEKCSEAQGKGFGCHVSTFKDKVTVIL